MSLKDELPDIMNFLDLDSEKQIENFQDAIQEVVKFTNMIQKKMQDGTAEDKEEVKEVLEELQTNMQSKMESFYEELGVTEDEIKEFAANPDNFKMDDWKALKGAHKSLDKITTNKEVNRIKNKKIKTERSDWIRS